MDLLRYLDGTLVGYRVISGNSDQSSEYNYPTPVIKGLLPFPHGLQYVGILIDLNHSFLVL